MSKALLNDIELWDAVRADDESAFNALFNRYWVRLYKTANSYFKDRGICEEIVHDVFLNIWNRRHELDIQILENFLLTAIRYQVYNKMRAAKLSLTYTDDTIEFVKGDTNSAEAKLLEEDFFIELKDEVEKLPKRCQEIFYLSRREHYSNEEIANQLGISKRTVDNQITLALKSIKGHRKFLTSLILSILSCSFLS